MKPHSDESYEDWSKRVAMFEHGHAMMQIAQDKDVEKVMEEMSRRIMDKLLHPIFKAIRESAGTIYDVETEKESYKQNYLNKNSHGSTITDSVDNEID